MNHNKYPKTKTITAAATMFLAGIGIGRTLPHNNTEAVPKPVPATVGNIAPTPGSDQQAEAIKPAVDPMASKLKAAQEFLQKTALTTANNILDDVKNPKSHSKPYNQTYIGNKEYLIAHDLQNKGGYPETLVQYDPKTKEAFISSVTSPNPTAPQDKQRFTSNKLVYTYTGSGLDNLNSKLASGGQLTATDYKQFLAQPGVQLTSTEVEHGNTTSSLTVDTHTWGYDGNVYDIKAPVTITDTTSDISHLYDMSKQLQVNEQKLRDGIPE